MFFNCLQINISLHLHPVVNIRREARTVGNRLWQIHSVYFQIHVVGIGRIVHLIRNVVFVIVEAVAVNLAVAHPDVEHYAVRLAHGRVVAEGEELGFYGGIVQFIAFERDGGVLRKVFFAVEVDARCHSVERAAHLAGVLEAVAVLDVQGVVAHEQVRVEGDDALGGIGRKLLDFNLLHAAAPNQVRGADHALGGIGPGHGAGFGSQAQWGEKVGGRGEDGVEPEGIGVAEIYALGVVIIADEFVSAGSKGNPPAGDVAEVEAAGLAAIFGVEEDAHAVGRGRGGVAPVELQAQRYRMGMLHAEFLVGAGAEAQHCRKKEYEAQFLHRFRPPFLK